VCNQKAGHKTSEQQTIEELRTVPELLDLDVAFAAETDRNIASS